MTDFVLYTRYVVYVMEKAIASMNPEETEQMLWILDLKGSNRKCFPPKAVCKEALNIFYTHYPERLHKLFIVDAPKVLSVFWAMLSAFLESDTKAKINFLSGAIGAGQKKTDALLEVIDVNVLESDYGGTNPSKDRGVIKRTRRSPRSPSWRPRRNRRAALETSPLVSFFIVASPFLNTKWSRPL